MVQQRYHDLPADERDAFAAACARHGFVVEDFEVNVAEHTATPKGPSASGAL